ncbi:MAG: response regulator [Candidatus Omnitrophica bacterium]|nr:response regulator [Candidatus Omnitrophota bacterium]
MAHKILVVEDERISLSLIRFGLLANRYEVLTAADGETGLNMLKSEKPDLVILDVGLPKLNGYEFMQEMKGLDEFSHTPVIVLTANETMEQVFKLEGIKQYYVKPVNMDQMIAKIKEYLGENE